MKISVTLLLPGSGLALSECRQWRSSHLVTPANWLKHPTHDVRTWASASEMVTAQDVAQVFHPQPITNINILLQLCVCILGPGWVDIFNRGANQSIWM